MRLYDYQFCNNLINGGWDSGIINNLKDARDEIKQNFKQMDFDNASTHEDMRDIVEEMVAEINQLISTIEAVYFR
ncbi:hypothetical protein LC087_18180 [Bacillus carboniphilus]|uniref:Uncharacterized protein n=1 Tax=Bacillus carboniphilus TaxID=86663 RepID=A0ABY9JUX0_9BACI|nr:hypothetical protein [Bacillus carboniphilus]WLR42584.1 hypothetical protein LC087_18180 [Bacillus carboniphilus]